MKFDPNIVRTSVSSPLGAITLAATDHGLAGVWFDAQQHQPDVTPWRVDDQHPVLVEAARQVRQYLAGQRDRFDLPLDLRGGTAFQQSVWHALLQIPFGATTTYGAVSQRVGRPKAVRAVGAAVGRNPLGIVVPCHRVLGADASLTGYAGGLQRKAALLELEAAPQERSAATR